MTTAEPPPALADAAFDPLPLGQIRPAGWLLAQLRTQADGLSGHLDEFWPDVARSGWIGGDAEGWERGPYWLDGIVPLAFLLDDSRLLGRVRHWVDYILDQQHADGWLGPTYHRWPDAPAILPPNEQTNSDRRYDPWPRAIIVKALIQFHEATGDQRIVPALSRYFRKLAEVIEVQPLDSWAAYRWSELVLGVHWLFGQTSDPALLRLADGLRNQGFDWQGHFRAFPFHERLGPDECGLSGHGPNNAMAIKTPAVWYRQSRNPDDLAGANRIIAELDRWHGQATGMFSCDEHLAGRSPAQGSELCAVVEYLYSLEVLIAITGRIEHADRLERLAFNALPATFSPDMWTHQYDQQVNQIPSRIVDDNVYTSNGPDANLYGLEPHFGCCTANMHQGWPKFASHLWMRNPDGGLAAVAWAPCDITTTVSGHSVRISVRTDYPFDGAIQLKIRSEGNTTWPLDLRIPGWAEDATVRVDGGATTRAMAGTFHRVEVRGPVCQVVIWFAMPVRVEQRSLNAVALSAGPLLLAHAIGERWVKVRERDTVADWEVHPTTPWNYALQPSSLDLNLRRRPLPAGRSPFAPDVAPVRVTVPARRLPGWGVEHGAAAPIPTGPIGSDEPTEQIDLIPFGCTNIRIAEFPTLAAQETGTAERER